MVLQRVFRSFLFALLAAWLIVSVHKIAGIAGLITVFIIALFSFSGYCCFRKPTGK